jgi:hypothetical protein
MEIQYGPRSLHAEIASGLQRLSERRRARRIHRARAR